MARRGIVVTSIAGAPMWVNINSIATVQSYAGADHSSMIAFTGFDETVWCAETVEEIVAMIEEPSTKS